MVMTAASTLPRGKPLVAGHQLSGFSGRLTADDRSVPS